MFYQVKLFVYSHHEVSSKLRSNISSEKAQNHHINKIFEFPKKPGRRRSPLTDI